VKSHTRLLLFARAVHLPTDFSGVGTYQLNASVFAGFLSGQYQLLSTPTFSASTQGSVRVGGTTYADVSLQGTLLETELPLSLVQNYASWPLQAR